VDEICDRFEAAWRAGQRPQIEGYLGDLPEPARPALFGELLRLDLHYRRQQREAATEAEYGRRFPAYADRIRAAFRQETVDHVEGFLGPGDDREDRTPTPTAFGKFQVVRPLGDGGQASTLLALDPDLRCHVVLKLYHRARTPAEREAVLREGQALARVRSPYVAACRGVERQDGVPALVVEYVPGRDLKEQQRARPLGVDQALALTGQLAEGLAAVHACGLLHRDLKPDNVLVGDDGRPRLVDFGLAVPVASTDLAGVSGTLPYMAPEQARGEVEQIDPRSDVFGLGAVLYELLTGQPPHQGGTREELWRAACAGDVVPPRQLNRRVPRAVSDLCRRCLAKSPAQRFASAAELATAVRRLQRWRRLRWPLAAAAVVLMVVGYLAFKPDPKPANVPEAVARPLSAKLDVRVWKKAGPTRGLTLAEPGALPLREGDWMRIEVAASRDAYLYVMHLDATGAASPLFPWRQYDWNDRPAVPPRASLNIPEDPHKDAMPLEPGPSGIESVFVLARPAPLTAGENDRLRQLLTGPAQKGRFDPLRGAVWLGGGEERFTVAADRGRPATTAASEMADPVERLRRLLRTELAGLAEASRGVCYPFAGR
jgi:hypothetical protein